MNNHIRFLLLILVSLSTLMVRGQYISICNSFDSTSVNLNIDTTGIWEIGKPTKAIFDSSYTGINSIVTDLDSLYRNGDTSRFYVVYKTPWGDIQNYLGVYFYPFQIAFTHRFVTDSSSDFGSIEMSTNGGYHWVNVLSNEYNSHHRFGFSNPNYHYFEGQGDTLFDSLAITGNSNGWVHSSFYKDLEQIKTDVLTDIDSVMVRFSFISDGAGKNEGWQIDNLCLTIDGTTGIDRTTPTQNLSIYPNPNNGGFSVNPANGSGQLEIYNLIGKKVFSDNITTQRISTHLPPGIYIVVLNQSNKTLTTKLIITK